MIITYGGLESLKVQFGDTILAFNPASKESKNKTPSFGADIVFVSLNHPDFDGVETVSRGDRRPFVVNGPGEYEVKGIFIRGFGSKSSYGGDERVNTVFLVQIEGMNICHLGALSSGELPPEVREGLDGIDVLFVPIGGDGVLKAAEAYKLALSLEPAVIIPVHYGDVGEKGALETFLKEGGGDKSEKQDKLTLKKKDLEGKEGEIIVLKAV